MSDHQNGLVRGIVRRLGEDASVAALLGEPARIWDQPPEDAGFPHVRIGACDSRPVAAEGGAVEHRLSLTVVSTFPGAQEARAVAAAVRAALEDARLEDDGVRTVSLGVSLVETFRATDLGRAYAVIRLRAVTEESGE